MSVLSGLFCMSTPMLCEETVTTFQIGHPYPHMCVCVVQSTTLPACQVLGVFQGLHAQSGACSEMITGLGWISGAG